MRKMYALGAAVGTAVGLYLLLLTLLNTPTVTAAPGEIPYPDQRDAVRAAVQWQILTHQNSDGGYTSFSQGANQAPSNVAGTLDAVLAIAGTGYNPAVPFPGKAAAPVDYLRAHAADVAAFAAGDGGQAGKVVLALVAANQEPRDFGGYNFAVSLTNRLSPTGQFNTDVPFKQALDMLGVAAVHETIPPSATQWLLDQQQADGAWADGFGVTDNVDATAMAIMALVAADLPPTHTALISATNFLAATQADTAAWPYAGSFGAPNANSTALAIQALSALGEDFYTAGGAWAKNGQTPIAALLTFQSQTGAFQADFGQGPVDDFFSTVQAIPAVSGKPYPLAGRREAARLALSCLETLQDPATAGWEQFAGFGANAAGTSRAIEAIAAYGDDPQGGRWTLSNTNAVEALENLTPAYITPTHRRGGAVGIVMQGVVAAGPPHTVTSFAGFNLPISVTSFLSPTGEYDNTAFGPFPHAEAMLGLIAAGEPVDPAAVAFLLNAQTGGDWGDDDNDGIALNVLGRLDLQVSGAIEHVRSNQLDDAGWGFGDAASPSSSSEIVQGLVQAGQNPFDPSWSVVVSGTIVNVADTLMSQQDKASGCWPNLFGPGNDPFSTTDAILLLTQAPGWPRYTAHLPLVLK